MADMLCERVGQSRMLVTQLVQKVSTERPHEAELIRRGHTLIMQLWDVELSWNNGGRPAVPMVHKLMFDSLTFLEELKNVFKFPAHMEDKYKYAQACALHAMASRNA